MSERDQDEMAVETPSRRVLGFASELKKIADGTVPPRTVDAWAAKDLLAALFSPVGDNHHNAALCPYCSPERARVPPGRDNRNHKEEGMPEPIELMRLTIEDLEDAAASAIKAAIAGRQRKSNIGPELARGLAAFRRMIRSRAKAKS